MARQARSIYQASRKATSFTQESVAEVLHVSVDTIRDYESGVTKVPDDIIEKMAALYDDPILELKHLSLTNQIFRKYFGLIDDTNFQTGILKFQKELIHVNKKADDLVEVGCDGKIEEHELQKWMPVAKEVQDIVTAGVIMLSTSKAKTVCVGAQTVLG